MRTTHTYVTVGHGSERHNHNLAFRKNVLQHTENTNESTVVELMKYTDYRTLINELMKPYIDEYNKNQDKKYNDDLDRYAKGELKNKPKKSNKKYKHKDDDYYTERINSVVYNRKTKQKTHQKAFDEVCVGFGSAETKHDYSRDEVEEIMRNTLEDIKKKFPNIWILGATIHFDEAGNHHMHIDYLPIYFKDQDKDFRELRIGINIDECMKGMGFEPSLSLINKSKKKPLYFNTFRNSIDFILEEKLNEHQILVERGVTKDRVNKEHLDKDEWLQTKVAANEIQNFKNDLLIQTEVISEKLEEKTDKLEDVEAALEKYSELSDLDAKIKLYKSEREKTILAELANKLIELINIVIDKLKQTNQEWAIKLAGWISREGKNALAEVNTKEQQKTGNTDEFTY